jgi:hypothetical protein
LLEISTHLIGSLVAGDRILLQRLQHHRVDARRQLRPKAAGWAWIVVDVL